MAHVLASFQLVPVVVGLGLFVGFLVGMTGMGGASLMTPLLILVAGARPVVAVGTDIAYSTITKLFGGAVHVRQGTVNWPTVRRLAYGSLPGSLLGVGSLAFFSRRLNADNLDKLVSHFVGMMLVLVAAVMLLRLAAPLAQERWPALRREPRDISEHGVWLPLLGFVVGYLVGFTSVGSGTMIVPVLSLLTVLPAAKIVGTDISHAVLLLAVSSVGHLALGTVDFNMTANLLIGSIPGVIVGSRLVLRVPEVPVRFALAAVLLVSAAKMI
ncbi:MAG TPA: sulfite exporter TauE/SafE family protein [Chloroflexota bacterium]|nr:sulfite exporter TauE/SafE family protein [Chloroflexota bacterium]